MIIKKFIFYLSIIFVLSYPNITLSNDNIYYLDLDYLMNNSLAGKSIIAKLDKKNKLNKKATWSNSLTLMTKVSRSKSSYVYVKELKVFIYITAIQKSVQVNKIKVLRVC